MVFLNVCVFFFYIKLAKFLCKSFPWAQFKTFARLSTNLYSFEASTTNNNRGKEKKKAEIEKEQTKLAQITDISKSTAAKKEEES